MVREGEPIPFEPEPEFLQSEEEVLSRVNFLVLKDIYDRHGAEYDPNQFPTLPTEWPEDKKSTTIKYLRTLPSSMLEPYIDPDGFMHSIDMVLSDKSECCFKQFIFGPNNGYTHSVFLDNNDLTTQSEYNKYQTTVHELGHLKARDMLYQDNPAINAIFGRDRFIDEAAAIYPAAAERKAAMEAIPNRTLDEQERYTFYNHLQYSFGINDAPREFAQEFEANLAVFYTLGRDKFFWYMREFFPEEQVEALYGYARWRFFTYFDPQANEWVAKDYTESPIPLGFAPAAPLAFFAPTEKSSPFERKQADEPPHCSLDDTQMV